jgi:hypothetical protein
VVGGCLFYKKQNPSPIFLRIDNIHCHFALSTVEVEIDKEIVHVLPLDRVFDSFGYSEM